MAVTRYDFLPASGSLGFVENLSRFSPFSSNNKICLSQVATANFWLLGDIAVANIFASHV